MGTFQREHLADTPQLATMQRMSEQIIRTTETLVHRQVELWSQSLEAVRGDWSAQTQRTSDELKQQIADTLSQAVQQHAALLHELEDDSRNRSHAIHRQLVSSLNEQNEVLQLQQQKMTEHGETLLKVVHTSGEVIQLEAALNPESQRTSRITKVRGSGHEPFGRHSSVERSPRNGRGDELRKLRSSNAEGTSRMSRRRVDADDVSVSLFPFLAVLICTVGALIVLLVVVVQQARVSAEEVTTQKQDQQQAYRQLLTNLRIQEQEADRLAKRASDFVVQIDVQKKQADQSRRQLEALQRRMSEIEKEESRLRALADRLDGEFQTAVASRRQASARKQALQSRIQNAQQLIAAAQEAAKNRKATYALVPYDGPYGTNRRPIYIECRRDRIILQPEGIELSQRDFRQPLGPENALASALRATREYWRETNGNSHQAYPLLVVKPDGAQTYAVARAALKFWDAEFGYELVPEEMELSYPQPDAEVAKRQQNAVAQAQLRQRIVRESLLGRAQETADDSPYLLRASNRGGFSRIPASPGLDNESGSSALRGRNSQRKGGRGTGTVPYQGRESGGTGRRANGPGQTSGYPYPSTSESSLAGNTKSNSGTKLNRRFRCKSILATGERSCTWRSGRMGRRSEAARRARAAYWNDFKPTRSK